MQYACNHCGFGKPLFYQANGKLKPSETKMTKVIHTGPETPQNCPVCHSTDLDLCLNGHDHKCRRGTVTGYCGRCGVDDLCYSATTSATTFGACSKSGNGASFTHSGPCLRGQPTYYEPQEEPKKCECNEMSCEADCSRNHTHKEFWCETCQPGRTEAVYGQEETEPEGGTYTTLDAKAYHEGINAERERILNLPCMQEKETDVMSPHCEECRKAGQNDIRRKIKDALQSK